jgi:1-acyl-sn-glycerol-3-phosphate acyltransferase
MKNEMSFLRSILITAPLIVLFTILFATVSVAVSFFDPTGFRQMRVARAWGRALCWICGIQVETEGLENLSPQGHYIVSPNHLSYMDTPVVLSALPVDFRFMAKEELFKIPFLGTHLKQAGHIAVPLEDPRGSIKALTHAARIINEKNISVLIFPEGGRSETGQLQEFKDGAAFTAIKAGIPIVPVALCGTREILPMHSMHVHGGVVRVRFGRPIPTAGLRSQDRAEVTSQVRSQIVTLLDSGRVATHV